MSGNCSSNGDGDPSTLVLATPATAPQSDLSGGHMRYLLLVLSLSFSTLILLAQKFPPAPVAPFPAPAAPVPAPPPTSAPDDPDSKRSGCVSGTVWDISGKPVQGGVVSLKDVTAGVIATTETNALGSYTICNLLPGDFSIWASKEALASRAETISITEHRLTKNIVLKR